MKITVAAFLLALAAYFLARGMGLPAWRSWQPGDAIDIAALVFVGVCLIIGDRA